MGNIPKETNKCSEITTSTLLGAINRAMEREYARDLAEQIASGDGIFLELDQLEEICGNLSKVTAMVRLVLNGARIGEFENNFSHDTHIAMRLASEKLETIEQMIEEIMPTKQLPQEMNSPSIQDCAS